MESLIKNTSDIVFTTAVAALAVTNPTWAVLFLTGKGIFGAWSDYGQARVNEIATSLAEKKGTFDSAILETDKFKSIFLSILERHMKESSDERRRLFRNYLISVAQGKDPNFDYHTKLLNVLDQITGEELRLFMLVPAILQDSDDNYSKYLAVGTALRDPALRDALNTMQVKMRLKNWKIRTRDLTSLLRFLSNYGLIVTCDLSAALVGGAVSNDIGLVGVTEAGQAFYDFIDDPVFNKEIMPWTEYRDNAALYVALQSES